MFSSWIYMLISFRYVQPSFYPLLSIVLCSFLRRVSFDLCVSLPVCHLLNWPDSERKRKKSDMLHCYRNVHIMHLGFVYQTWYSSITAIVHVYFKFSWFIMAFFNSLPTLLIDKKKTTYNKHNQAFLITITLAVMYYHYDKRNEPIPVTNWKSPKINFLKEMMDFVYFGVDFKQSQLFKNFKILEAVRMIQRTRKCGHIVE